MAHFAKTSADRRGRYWLTASFALVLLIGLGFRLMSSNETLPNSDGLLPEARASSEAVQGIETTRADGLAHATSSSERKSIETPPGDLLIESQEGARWPETPRGASKVDFGGRRLLHHAPIDDVELPNANTVKAPVIEMGRLSILLPYGLTLRADEAMQYTVRPVGGDERATLSETVIGGREDQNFRGLKMTSIGIEFEAVAVGSYKLDAHVLRKRADGRWVPTTLRLKGEASVQVAQTTSCVVR